MNASPRPAIVPDFSPFALTSRANGHLTVARYARALEMLEAAVAVQPRYMPAHNEMGNCLKGMGRHADAIGAYEHALTMAPATPEIHQNLGATYLDLGDMARAAQHCITAITGGPHLTEARWNLAITLLSSGNLYEGFLQARARWGTHRFIKWMPKYKMPAWNGEKDARVMVWGEQGLGERILFAPMVAELQRYLEPGGGKVMCDADPRMIAMLQRSFQGIEFVLEGDVLQPGECTHQIAMGDLGIPFRDALDKFPPPAAYLKADTRRSRAIATQVRAYVKGKGKKLVGLSWKSGNTEYGAHKSMTLFDLGPIIELEDVVCINLQYGDTREEREALGLATGLAIADAGVDLKADIESVASLMMACDVVVSVSNTHAHLAAALGCPTWVALPRHNARFWYWFLDRTDSPWYPRARLYRQARHGRWDTVIEAIAKDLGELGTAPKA